MSQDRVSRERDALLVEREESHGDFSIQGRWAQEMKGLLRSTPNFGTMLACKGESLDMIVTKISRILHGKANVKDHWDDIAGYAKLGAEACE